MRRLKAAREEQGRAEARRKRELNRARWPSPLDMAAELDPYYVDEDGEPHGVVRTPALELINSALVDLADGRENRLSAMMAPQEGKSTTVSYWFPLWLLTCVNPDLRILIVSYSDEMARRWGGDIKNALEQWSGDEGTYDLGLRLRKDSRAAGRWNIAGHKGSIYCAGVNGSITGKPGDVIIVDDPIRNMIDAQSEKIREKAMSTYQSVLVPRMGPKARVAWIQTCWHEDEPIRRILANEGDKASGGRWRVISIPAVAESDDDILGRKRGEGMVSARGDRDWKQIAKTVGPYVFAALYQQRPAPAEGNLFKRLWWRYWSPGVDGYLHLGSRVVALEDCWRFATVDLAASTKASADWTVISVWARTPDRDLVLLDRVRAHISENDHFTHAQPLVQRWKLDTLFVERSQYGMTLVREAANAGVSITPLDTETDKLSRALPASAWAAAGRVWLPAGAWWTAVWVNEHAAFPNSKNDDQVDTFSYAVRVSVTRAGPTPKGPPPPPDPAGVVDWNTVPM
ncbi:phage terminase large subunit [Micromonospora pisi]|uniref:phage terminase large subunit n=1 Tax=Micromonospora pisi TaxID=589240 RepID=UPI0014773D7B|nr:phage terminase large subunit [Micromonospora pisi]